MTVKELCNRAKAICGIEFDINSVAVIYYNELIDYLLNLCPNIITKNFDSLVYLDGDYKIPSDYANIINIYDSKYGKIRYSIVDNTIITKYKGNAKIVYTKKPCYSNSATDILEHNPAFDIFIPYFLAFKVAVANNLTDNLVQLYYTQYKDYFDAVIKGSKKLRKSGGIDYIKSRPFI